MKLGQNIPLTSIHTDQHFTEPPPRFSEASLVKALEEYGIGRPSTYASIIQVLLYRDYVQLDNKRFKPSDVGRAVSNFLTSHFMQYVDYDFTAKLEDELDAVARGEEDWIPLLERFWKPFKATVDDKSESVDRTEATGARLLGTDAATGKPINARLGRYGPFVQIGTAEDEDKPKFASLRPGQSMHTITLEEALKLFTLPRKLGELDGKDLTVAIGRFGPFAKRGDTYASLGKEDDPYVITYERAAELIRAREELIANRLIKVFPGTEIQVLNGKYGAYITDGEKNGKIPKDRDPKSLTQEECEAILLAAPVRPQRGRFGKKAPAKKAPARKAAKKVVEGEGKPAVKKAAVKKAAKKKKPAKKKATTKKAAAKKAATTKTGATVGGNGESAVAGKSVAKKAVPKKAAAKKAVVKKAVMKKAAAKKTTARASA